MSELDTQQQDRRKVIKLLGTSAAALPVLGLTGCGGGDEAASGSTAADLVEAAEDVASDAMDTASEAVDSLAEGAESVVESAEEVVGDAMDAVEDKAQEMADAVGDAVGEVVDGAKVDEASTQAQSLGYKHDATMVDSGTQTRYAAGQQCSNCTLFQGGDSEWGACPIFAGDLVKSSGWCSAYVAAS